MDNRRMDPVVELELELDVEAGERRRGRGGGQEIVPDEGRWMVAVTFTR